MARGTEAGHIVFPDSTFCLSVCWLTAVGLLSPMVHDCIIVSHAM